MTEHDRKELVARAVSMEHMAFAYGCQLLSEATSLMPSYRSQCLLRSLRLKQRARGLILFDRAITGDARAKVPARWA